MLKYALFKNPLKPGTEEAVAVVQERQTYTVQQVISQLTAEGSILKDVETQAVLQAFFKRLVRNMAEGIGFQSPYFSLNPSIQGVFSSDDDSYDASRHQVAVNLNPGPALRGVTPGLSLQKVAGQLRQPFLKSLYDKQTDTYNEMITAGDTAVIKGEKLKIYNEANPEEGIFFVNISDAEVLRVDKLYTNTNSTLDFRVPDLPSGNYRVEVRSSLYQGGKSTRTGALNQVVEVL